MAASSTRDRIPAHLRQFVVEQEPAHYDELDSAVWRFVTLVTRDQLLDTAHPAYRDGMAQTGLELERPASIRDMDASLAKYGWGAVAVDGFIPPRAFMEFQALRVMTIAAEIRTSDHTVYTPAPDLLHESVGHAPIIPDPEYRAFLQRIGEIGARAFSLPQDQAVYEAIRRLSDLKEDPQAAPADVAVAEAQLEAAHAAQASLGRPSEATQVSRLHWWTVEYGLVGTPEDYKIYGAGILSSIAESHLCHDPEVRKIPLGRDCIEVDYDITRRQPQLFVARDFAHLAEVAEQVAGELAQTRGGALALERALASQETATLRLDSGLEIIGRLGQVLGDGGYLKLEGPCALAFEGRILPEQGRAQHPEGFGCPVGPLRDGSRLGGRSEAELRALAAPDGTLALDFASGVRVQGRLARVVPDPSGRPLLLSLEHCRVSLGDTVLFRPDWGVFDLALGTEIVCAKAGASDPAYWPPTEYSGGIVPPRRVRRGRDAALLELYQRALAIWRERPDAGCVAEFEKIAGELDRSFPDEWLLRWNLLECLRKADCGPELEHRLRSDLEEIEARSWATVPRSLAVGYLDRTYPRR